MSTKHEHLSLGTVIFININIMIGTGLFINTTELAKRAGVLGAFSYGLVGLLMLPLILSIAHLLRMHPSGGFYVFAGKEISKFAGFMSSWAYFTGKLASVALAIHTAVLLAQSVFPILAHANIYAIDVTVLTLFVLLNMLHVKMGGTIQALFVVLKFMPILYVLLVGLYLFNGVEFTASDVLFEGVPSTLPLILFSILGFEAACSVSNKLHDARKNGPRAVLTSFAIVISISIAYQLLFYSALGQMFKNIVDYRGAFPALTAQFFGSEHAYNGFVNALVYLGIAISALGSAYGILFTNIWNLYALAEHNHTFMPAWIMRFNSQSIPTACVLVEWALCVLYLFVTGGSQLILQPMSALTSVIAYTLSMCALLQAKRKNRADDVAWWIPILGLFNCCLLMTSCVYSLFFKGFGSLIMICVILTCGAGMFFYKKCSIE